MTKDILSHLLVASLQGGLFVTAVYLVCRILKRLPAVWKCWLWRLTSAKFVVGVALAATIPIVVSTPVRNSPIVSAVQRAQTVPSIEQDEQFRPGQTPSLSDRLHGAPAVAGVRPLSRAARTIETVTVRTEAPPQPAFNYRAWLVGLWLLGLVVMAVRAVVAWRRVRQLLKSPSAADSIEAGRFDELLTSSRVKGKFSVRVVDNLSAPALLGLVAPAIAIPRDAGNTSHDAIRSAVAHEIAHLKRHDIAWMLLAELVKTVFWFHPLAWVSCREQRIECEIAADELARRWTQTPFKTYAVHLLEWVDPSRRATTTLPMARLPIGPGALSSTHELTRRVTEMSLSRYRRRAAAALGSLIAFPLAAGLAPIMLVAASHGLANSPWPKFQGGVSNSGRGGGTPAIGRHIWTYQAPCGTESGPTIGPGGLVYIGSVDGIQYALDSSSGKVRWLFKSKGIITGSAAVGSNGLLYFGSQDGKIYALDATTGKEKWEYATGGIVYGSPAIGSDGTIYAGSWDGNLYALNGQTGAKRWAFPTGGRVNDSSALGEDGTVYIGSQNSELYALDGATGIKKWSFKGGDAMVSTAVGPDGTVYAGSWDGNLYALDGQSGVKKWAYQTGDEVSSSPAIGSDGLVYVGSNDQRVYGIDAQTGEQKWSFVTEGPVYASPAIGSDGTVYIGSNDGKFYALVGATGWKKWDMDVSERVVSSPAIGSDGTLYFGGVEGTVYALH